MRVLVVSVSSPTPIRGGVEVRLNGAVSALRDVHDVHVLCYGESVDIEGVSSTVLSPPQWSEGWRRRLDVGLGVLAGEPLAVRTFRRGGLGQAAAVLVGSGRFDVAHVSHAPSGFAGASLGDLPQLCDFVDAWHLNRLERLDATGRKPTRVQDLKLRTIRRYERSLLKAFPISVVSSERDRQALLELDRSARIAVIPNGVDVEAFRPDTGTTKVAGLVTFHGSLDYEPNEDAAVWLSEEIMPIVRRKVPHARLRLVGRSPSSRIRALASEFVEILADVPDVRPLLDESEVACCPMRFGSGVKNKLLESAAIALPVVATPNAAAGLDFADGREIILRESAADIAAALTVLLFDGPARQELGRAARGAVEQRWAWGRVVEAFSSLYQELRA
jgi:polysaccharide biosynthesis protein PslH